MTHIMNETEINKMIDDILEYESLSDVQKEKLDFFEEDYMATVKKESIYISLTKSLTKWYIHQIIYQNFENYELCARIRDVVELEINDSKRLIETYFNPINKKEINKIEEIKNITYEIAHQAYEQLSNAID